MLGNFDPYPMQCIVHKELCKNVKFPPWGVLLLPFGLALVQKSIHFSRRDKIVMKLELVDVKCYPMAISITGGVLFTDFLG